MIRLLMVTAPMPASGTSIQRARRGAGAAGLKLTRIRELPAPHPRSLPPRALTWRQTQVLQGISLGYSTKEIASQLRISIKTAETHRAAIFHRLRINHVPGLVRYALQTGVVPVSWLFTDSRGREEFRHSRALFRG